MKKLYDYRDVDTGCKCKACGKPIKSRLIDQKRKRPRLCYLCWCKAECARNHIMQDGCTTPRRRKKRLAVTALILFVLAAFFATCAGCCAPSRALREMCLTQEHALTRYVEVANGSLSAEWRSVGSKLVRNQATINKLVGVRRGQK